MELIDKQEAINMILGLPPERHYPVWYAGQIRQLPSAQPEQQWIPCNWHKDTENLPDECESVLICIKDKIGTYVDVSYRTDYNRWERYGRNINVVAWMPLPEPYRKDGD